MPTEPKDPNADPAVDPKDLNRVQGPRREREGDETPPYPETETTETTQTTPAPAPKPGEQAKPR